MEKNGVLNEDVIMLIHAVGLIVVIHLGNNAVHQNAAQRRENAVEFVVKRVMNAVEDGHMENAMILQKKVVVKNHEDGFLIPTQKNNKNQQSVTNKIKFVGFADKTNTWIE
uniref:Uncharacterized protein n=2 Tax=Meloidogyne TaxID=189290 RepID=A0A6V7W7D8_MELEN|nr:unnamed protein product [Meloidogyne enterolobii]